MNRNGDGSDPAPASRACRSRAASSGRGERVRRWAGKRRNAFLETLRSTLDARRAARAVGASANEAYAQRRCDAEFAGAWDRVIEESYIELELQRQKLLIHGTTRTETVRDGQGEDAAVKSVRTIHSFSPATMGTAIVAHRRFMQSRAGQEMERPDDEDVADQLLGMIAGMRERQAPRALAGPAIGDAEEAAGREDGADGD